MNKEKLFINFLESLRDENNGHMIDAINEGFALTEGFRIPDIKNGAADAIDSFKNRMKDGKPARKLSDDEVAARKAKFDGEEKKAKQQDWRVSGSMASVVKFAQTNPSMVEKWLETTLKPAIRAGKESMDREFGTDSAKRGIFDRVKSAAKSFTESGDRTIIDYKSMGESPVSNEQMEDYFHSFDKKYLPELCNGIAQALTDKDIKKSLELFTKYCTSRADAVAKKTNIDSRYVSMTSGVVKKWVGGTLPDTMELLADRISSQATPERKAAFIAQRMEQILFPLTKQANEMLTKVSSHLICK